MPKKTGELTEVEDIVYKLSELGIITNAELWKKKLKNDINDYWSARKAANYLK